MRKPMAVIATAVAAVLALAAPVSAGSAGSLVTTFGAKGSVTVPTVTSTDHGVSAEGAAARAPSGRIYVATKRHPRQRPGSEHVWIEVTAWTSAGRIDTSFHGGKPMVLGPGAGWDGRDGLVLLGPWVTPSGGVALAVRDYNGAVVYRLTPSGQLDTRFSADGKARIESGTFGVTDITMLSSGAFRALDVGDAGAEVGPATLVGLTSSGAPDTAVGPGGRRALGLPWVLHLVTDTADRLYLLQEGRSDLASLTVYRLASSGAIDATWGTSTGHSVVALPGARSGHTRLAVGPDGSLFAGVSKVRDPASGFRRPLIVKLDPTGALDAAFGTAGLMLIPSASGGGAIDAFAVDPGGRLLLGLHEMPGFQKLIERRSGVTGALDAAFGSAGKVTVSGVITSLTPVTTSFLTVSPVTSGGSTRIVLARRWN